MPFERPSADLYLSMSYEYGTLFPPDMQSPSSYPEMLGIHVKNLASVLTETDSGQLQDRLDERLRAFADGEIDHASEAFSSLWRTLTTKNGEGGLWGEPRKLKSLRRNKVRYSPFCRGAINPNTDTIAGGWNTTEDSPDKIHSTRFIL